MLLVGRNGVSVHLSVAGYQFPGRDPEPDGGDWDANWLVIAGRVRTAAGRTWSFRYPGLTTWEVAEVADWLERAARGEVAAVPAWTHADDPVGGDLEGGDAVDGVEADDEDAPFWWDELDEHGWKVFLEPCLSLGVAEVVGAGDPVTGSGDTAEQVRLLVGLGAEWAPPPFPEQAHDWRCVELHLDPGQLARAAAELREEPRASPGAEPAALRCVAVRRRGGRRTGTARRRRPRHRLVQDRAVGVGCR